MDCPDSQRCPRFLFVIFVVAIVVRAGLLAYVECRPGAFDFPDSHRYIAVARNIAAGKGPIDSERVRSGTDPLYPYVLSLGVRAGLESDEAIARMARIVNSIASLASIGLVFALGRRILGPIVGLAAASILAVEPLLLFFNGLVLTETVFIAFLLAGSLGIVFVRGPRPLLASVVAGLCIGFAILTRSTSLGLLLVLAPLVWATSPGSRTFKWTSCLLFVFAVLLVIAPQAMRNHRLFGTWVVLRTGAGASLLEAFGDWADGGPGMDRIQYPPTPPGANEYETDRIYRQNAMDWVKGHPGRSIRLAVAKAVRTWSPFVHAARFDRPVYQAVALITTLPIFVLAILGARRLKREPAWLYLLLAPAAYFTLVHMIFVGSVRYRLPAMPFLFVLAAAGATLLFGRKKHADGVSI